MISLKKCSPFQPEVSKLIDELDAYQGTLYPPASNYHDSREILNQPNCHFIAAYEDEEICGIGAVKLFDHYGEIKRVYVPVKARGKGIAQIIVKELENFLLQREINLIRLETGIHHLDAINLYHKLGYVRTSVFGDYTNDPLSVFMEKKI
ncbi:MAG: GNAT family N-acetyltransferase [Bdellovibrionales bacterium]|nr:GNAT family N-acetyltransferase [Bdellovibrionales bacterium]